MLIINKYKQTVGIILAIALFFTYSSVASANQTRSQLLEAANIKKSGAYVRDRFLKKIKRPFNQQGKKNLLIIGDSHAQDFLNGVLDNGFLRNYEISTRYISGRCQIFSGNKKYHQIEGKDRAYCAKSDTLQQAKAQIAEANVIVLASNWKEWAAKALPQTIRNMALKPNQKIFVIGRKSFGKIAIRHYLRLPEQELRNLQNKPDGHQQRINTVMRNSLSPAVFVDTQRLVCGISATCPVFTPNLKLISFDGGHLTKDGALYVGKLLFRESGLASL